MPERARPLREEDVEISTPDKADLELIEGGIVEGVKLSEQEPIMTFEMANSSEKGETHVNNEDSSFIDPENGTAGVFDGSTEAGNIASGIANEVIQRELASIPDEADMSQTIDQMKTAFRQAHEAINAEVSANPDLEGMTTSATIVKFFEGPEGKKAIIINAGDSRAYVKREGTSTIEQVTTDDNMVDHLIKYGDFRNNQDLSQAMTDKGAELLVNAILSKEEAAKRKQEHNYNSLVFGAKKKFKTLSSIRGLTTNSLGGNSSEPKVTIIDINNGDQLLLTSDGIHDNLENEGIKNSLDNTNSVSNNAKDLITKANEASRSTYTEDPSIDDMTCVLIEVEDTTPLELTDLIMDDDTTSTEDLVAKLDELGTTSSK